MGTSLRRLLALTGTMITAVALAVTPAASAAPSAETLLSQNKPATASSTGGDDYAAKNAVDGNTGTRWASAAGVDPQWIYLDLGQSATISRIKLTWDLSCAVDYRLQVSADLGSWTDVKVVTGADGAVDEYAVAATGKYVRMHGTKRCRATASKGYSLQEFQVYGEFGSPDTQPPTVPGSPRSTGVTSTTASLAWNASSDNVGVTAYDIYNTGQLLKTVNAQTLATTLTGLTPNTSYSFYLTARDAAGNVSQSTDNVEVKTPPDQVDNEPPSVPGNLRSTGVTGTSIALAWNASTDNVGVTGYDIFRDGSTKLGSASGTSTTLGGLTPNTEYKLTAKAKDAAGNSSAASSQLTVKTSASGCSQPVCTATQITTSTDVPWGLVFLEDGSALVAERDTFNVTRVTRAGQKTTVGKVPNGSGTAGEGGLMGLELSPTFASDHWLYIMHTSPSDNRIVRMKYENGALGAHQVLLTGIVKNKFHNGGRLRFGPDGKLYATAGDGQSGGRAQDKNSLNGKILRINPDGTVPSDNPFGNAVWSMGHRNPQGLAFDSQGRLWEAELGNSVMDEVNLIQRGGNYGWPSCEGTSGSCGGFIAPKKTWSTSSASPSGLAIVNDVVYVAALKGERIYRMPITGSSLGSATSHFQGSYGRLRTVEPSPDGGLWFTSSNGDKDSTPNNSSTKILHVALG